MVAEDQRKREIESAKVRRKYQLATDKWWPFWDCRISIVHIQHKQRCSRMSREEPTELMILLKEMCYHIWRLHSNVAATADCNSNISSFQAGGIVDPITLKNEMGTRRDYRHSHDILSLLQFPDNLQLLLRRGSGEYNFLILAKLPVTTSELLSIYLLPLRVCHLRQIFACKRDWCAYSILVIRIVHFDICCHRRKISNIMHRSILNYSALSRNANCRKWEISNAVRLIQRSRITRSP